MDRWGRKAGMIYCAFFSLLGGALLCGANGVVSIIEHVMPGKLLTVSMTLGHVHCRSLLCKLGNWIVVHVVRLMMSKAGIGSWGFLAVSK